ncbi:DNA adenine methylase [Kitasatospora sp. NPDC101176]|uniref:DNA adenine methylase n=1 Tax=Kitasatospora sp. NPDC101176 TaxID=3364099 RepID=UPI0037FD8495
MHIHCDRCGFERDYTGAMNQDGVPCAVCVHGRMRNGVPARGFTVVQGVPVPRDMQVPYVPFGTGEMDDPTSFHYFAAGNGRAYEAFVRANSCYVGRMTNLWMPEPGRFAWLSPYTGNMHNRAHFTQLVIARVARAKFTDNGGRFPRLIEPFVGSGQVFLNATAFGPGLNDGMRLFRSVVAGDLNPYVLGAYRALVDHGGDFVREYGERAARWDEAPADTYRRLLDHLEANGRREIAETDAYPVSARRSVSAYIWLVNRCTRGTKLSEGGGLQGTFNPEAGRRLAAIRARETATLTAIAELCGTAGIEDFACRDFRTTCDLAGREDVVFLDCPFPKFSNSVPPGFLASPETFGSQSAATYGTGNDGAAFQTSIVAAVRELVERGTTVLVCNFANPGLVQAYARLLGRLPDGAEARHYTYTYRSPTTTSEAYQLTLLPGRGNPAVALSPQRILADWVRAGGDDALNEEFFRDTGVFAMEEDEDDVRHARREQLRQEAQTEYVVSGDEDESFDDV